MKIPITILLLVLTSTCYCQIDKKNILLDAGMQVLHQPIEWNRKTGYALQADIGFLVTERWMLGFGLSQGLDIEDFGNQYGGIRSLLRYYFHKKGNHTGFLHQQLSYERRTFSYALGIGWGMALNRSIVLESRATYSRLNPKFGDTYSDLDFSIGLQFLINKSLRETYTTWPSPLEQGNWMIGGSTAFINRSSGITQMAIRPSIGYFLSNRLVAGAKIHFTRSQVTRSFPIKLTIWELTPFFRFFVSAPEAKVFAFIGAAAGHYAQSFQGGEGPETAFQASTELGFGVMVSPTVAFDIKLVYESLGRISTNRKWILDFGFQYYLTP